MKVNTYRDMHLLNEVTQTPDATQRDLSQRIGIALGLTNLMLRRLAKKGYIKVVNVQKSRLRYLITPQGVIEKARLAREYLEYSLFFYRHVRVFLRERLVEMGRTDRRRILLWGTGELAEIAFLTINELGLELAGVVDEPRREDRFLGRPVQPLDAVPTLAYDRIIVASGDATSESLTRLGALGVPMEHFIILPIPGLQGLDPSIADAGEAPPAVAKTQETPAQEAGLTADRVAVPS